MTSIILSKCDFFEMYRRLKAPQRQHWTCNLDNKDSGKKRNPLTEATRRWQLEHFQLKISLMYFPKHTKEGIRISVEYMNHLASFKMKKKEAEACFNLDELAAAKR